MDFDSKIMPKKYQRKQENKAGALSFSHFLSYAANIPVDTGRKLNVLCTFNLRSVSTANILDALRKGRLYSKLFWSVFSPNAWKYESEKTSNTDIF